MLTEKQMYKLSFKRPKNYFKLSSREQWAIDKSLGILDWIGDDLTEAEIKKFKDYYED